MGHVGPPGQALQALSESHNGPTGPGDFRAVPRGHRLRPPGGRRSPTCRGRGHLGQWLPHPRQVLGMNYFSTFPQEQTGVIRRFLTKGEQELIKA